MKKEEIIIFLIMSALFALMWLINKKCPYKFSIFDRNVRVFYRMLSSRALRYKVTGHSRMGDGMSEEVFLDFIFIFPKKGEKKYVCRLYAGSPFNGTVSCDSRMYAFRLKLKILFGGFKKFCWD